MCVSVTCLYVFLVLSRFFCSGYFCLFPKEREIMELGELKESRSSWGSKNSDQNILYEQIHFK